MLTMHDPLMFAADRINHALGEPWYGRERAWLRQYRFALQKAAVALRQRPVATERALLAPVQAAERKPFPTLTRSIGLLRCQQMVVIRTLHELLVQTKWAGEAGLPRLCVQGRQLHSDLHKLRAGVNKLILETAWRDTGTGD